MNGPPASAPPSRAPWWRRHGTALCLVAILALVAAVRIRLLSVPLERDEGEYAYAGQLMLEGEPPYKLAYNMKMPGIYAAYAAIMAVFGETTEGIRLGFIFVNAGAIVLMYFLARRLLENPGAIAASATYAFLSTSPGVQGINAHATHFVVLAAIGGILVLQRAQESGRLWEFFLSGALLGLSFLMKQPGGAFVAFGFTLLLWAAWQRRPPDWKADGLRAVAYACGAAGPIVLTGIILWRAGVWDKFWWWTVGYARVHATAISWTDGMTRLGNSIKGVQWDWVFWLLALAGLTVTLTGKGKKFDRFFYLTLLLFSAASVVPTLNFTRHYFVLLQPAVALLAAKCLTVLAARLASDPSKFMRASPWTLLAVLLIVGMWVHRGVFFVWSPEETARRMYPSNDFQAYPALAKYLQTHSPPSATFAVFGSEPELAFYAHRRSVTGYIYMYDLVEEQPLRDRMEKEMLAEVERGQPDYIIFVNLVFSWLPYPPKNLEGITRWMENYTDAQYVPYGVVTFPPNQYFFQPDCLQVIPPKGRFITVFQRKSSRSLSSDARFPKTSP